MPRMVLTNMLALLAVAGCATADEKKTGLWTIEQVEVAGGEAKCVNATAGGALGVARSSQREEGNYRIPVWPGAVLGIGLKEMTFPEKGDIYYRWQGREKPPLVWSRKDGAAMLNDRVTHLALTVPAGEKRLKDLKPKEIAALESAVLSGNPAQDLANVRRLKGFGGFIILDHASPGETEDGDDRDEARGLDKTFIAALAATEATGLVLRRAGPNISDLLAAMDKVEYLELTSVDEPFELPKMPRLRQVDLPAWNAKYLAKYPDDWPMEAVMFKKSKDLDLAQPARFSSIQSLSFSSKGKPVDLAPLAKLKNLQILTIFNKSGIKSSKALRKLRNVEILMLLQDRPLPADEIAAMPKLRSLIVLSDRLDSDEVNKLRKARPKLEIVGYCMGSVWLAAAVGLGLVGGLVRRRRRGRSAA